MFILLIIKCIDKLYVYHIVFIPIRILYMVLMYRTKISYTLVKIFSTICTEMQLRWIIKYLA